MTPALPDSPNVWDAAPSYGKSYMYHSGQELMAAAIEYFEWSDEHPMLEEVINFYQGVATKDHKEHRRPYSVASLLLFLGVDSGKWSQWMALPEFRGTIETINMIIRQQKFDGAAVGFYNANLISRDLGLADKSELSGVNGGPITVEQVDREAKDFASRMRDLMSKAAGSGLRLDISASLSRDASADAREGATIPHDEGSE
jgi:hypothetical protein